MGAPVTQQDRVIQALDIPTSAANLGDVGAVTAVAGVTNYYMTNRLTFFEELVIAITDGYAASGRNFENSEAFAREACQLARTIAFERDKYSNI